MPHAWIEYSANIKDEPEVQTLKETLYRAALETGIFPIGGIRVRAQVIDDYIVGDAHPDNGFVHIVLRIGSGRDMDVKKAAADRAFAQIKEHLKSLAKRAPLAVAFEVQEMSVDLNYKFNNLHEHIQRRQN